MKVLSSLTQFLKTFIIRPRFQSQIRFTGPVLDAMLKRYVVPKLSHEVFVADVVYPAVLLAHGRPLGLIPTMVSSLQSGLRVLTLSLCHVEIMEDDEGNAILDKNGEPKRKTPNPCWATLYLLGSLVPLGLWHEHVVKIDKNSKIKEWTCIRICALE